MLYVTFWYPVPVTLNETAKKFKLLQTELAKLSALDAESWTLPDISEAKQTQINNAAAEARSLWHNYLQTVGMSSKHVQDQGSSRTAQHTTEVDLEDFYNKNQHLSSKSMKGPVS